MKVVEGAVIITVTLTDEINTLLLLCSDIECANCVAVLEYTDTSDTSSIVTLSKGRDRAPAIATRKPYKTVELPLTDAADVNPVS